MSKMVLLVIGLVVLLMALLASFDLAMATEPIWHIVIKWIAGGLMVIVAFLDKKKESEKSE